MVCSTDMIQVKQYINNLFTSNSYLVRRYNEKDCLLVDCGDSEELFSDLHNEKLNVVAVLLTHAHFDHICGLNLLLEHYPSVEIFTNDFGQESLLSDKLNLSKYHSKPFVLADGKRITVLSNGQLEIDLIGIKANIFFVPGHNPSCIAYRIDDYLFSGDAFIPGVKVVTNIPKADKSLAIANYNYLESISNNCTICAGHGVIVKY